MREVEHCGQTVLISPETRPFVSMPSVYQSNCSYPFIIIFLSAPLWGRMELLLLSLGTTLYIELGTLALWLKAHLAYIQVPSVLALRSQHTRQTFTLGALSSPPPPLLPVLSHSRGSLVSDPVVFRPTIGTADEL